MIRFKEYLKEDRVDFLKNLFMPKYKDLVKIDQIIAIDPTHNKAYAQWLLNLGLKDSRIVEDSARIKNDLILFDKVKHKLDADKRDINRYKTQAELFNAIEPYTDFKSGKEIKADEKEQFRKAIKVVYKGPEGSIEIPLTEPASCFLGRGTRWCTAAENDNYFDRYNRLGPLYVISTKDGRKYQFHLSSSQLMDEKDDHVDLGIFDKKYPWVFKNINFSDKQILDAVENDAHAIWYAHNPSEKLLIAACKIDSWVIQFIDNPSEAVQLAAVNKYGSSIQCIDNPTEEVKMAAVIQSPMALKHIKNPSEEIQLAAINSRQFTQYNQELEFNAGVLIYIKNPSEAVQIAAVKRDGTLIDNFKKPSEAVQMAAVKQNLNALYLIRPDDLSKDVFNYVMSVSPKIANKYP